MIMVLYGVMVLYVNMKVWILWDTKCDICVSYIARSSRFWKWI